MVLSIFKLSIKGILSFNSSYRSDKPSPCSAEKGTLTSKPNEELSVRPNIPPEPSHLFTSIMTGLLLILSFFENVFSAGSTPALPSITNITKSDSSIATLV